MIYGDAFRPQTNMPTMAGGGFAGPMKQPSFGMQQQRPGGLGGFLQAFGQSMQKQQPMQQQPMMQAQMPDNSFLHQLLGSIMGGNYLGQLGTY